MVTKSHFMHGHALVLNINTTDYYYVCDGCKTPGYGKNFRCQPCNFNMHEFCIDCPTELPSFLHPQHSLLVQNSQFATSLTTCDVCGDSVNGLFYCCRRWPCNFNVHPLCTKLPQFLRHAVDGVHHLAFQKPSLNAACCVCGDVCDSWRYRCGECGFNVHLECVTKPYGAAPNFTPPPSAGSYTHGGSTSRRPPPYAGSYTLGGVICSPNPSPSPNLNMWNPTYGYQPNLSPNPLNMCNPAYGYHPSPNPNPLNMCNPAYGYHPNPHMHNSNAYSGMPSHMYYANGGNSYGWNVHSHHIAAENVQSNSSQGHGSGRLGSKIFKIVSTLTLGVVSNVIFGALVAVV